MLHIIIFQIINSNIVFILIAFRLLFLLLFCSFPSISLVSFDASFPPHPFLSTHLSLPSSFSHLSFVLVFLYIFCHSSIPSSSFIRSSFPRSFSHVPSLSQHLSPWLAPDSPLHSLCFLLAVLRIQQQARGPGSLRVRQAMGQDEAGAPQHGGETPQRTDVEVSVQERTLEVNFFFFFT